MGFFFIIIFFSFFQNFHFDFYFYLQRWANITSGFDKTNRNTFFNHSSSAPSPSTVSLLRTTANSILLDFDKANGKNELWWWINNLELCNDRLNIQSQSQVLIETDASKKVWGTVCRGIRTVGQWFKIEQGLHINQLELLAIKFAILIFAKMREMSAIHNQVDSMTALSYLLKMGGIKNPDLTQISKNM